MAAAASGTRIASLRGLSAQGASVVHEAGCATVGWSSRAARVCCSRLPRRGASVSGTVVRGFHSATTLHRGSFGSMFSSTPSLLGDRPPVRLGKVSPGQPVPAHIPRPPYVEGSLPNVKPPLMRWMAPGVQAMKDAGSLAARALAFAGTLVKPGVTGEEIDKLTHEFIIQEGGYPSPLGYSGFPKSICVSVNEVVCHGIPDDRPLQEGDIVGIDVSVYLNGVHGDNCRTFACGQVNEKAAKLMQVSKDVVDVAVGICGPGVAYHQIGKTIEEYVRAFGFTSVKGFAGHGVGRHLHTEPTILHYNEPAYPGTMVPNTVFTIEPMINEGGYEVKILEDGWTVVTKDGGLSSQFEHSVLITETGAEVITGYTQ